MVYCFCFRFACVRWTYFVSFAVICCSFQLGFTFNLVRGACSTIGWGGGWFFFYNELNFLSFALWRYGIVLISRSIGKVTARERMMFQSQMLEERFTSSNISWTNIKLKYLHWISFVSTRNSRTNIQYIRFTWSMYFQMIWTIYIFVFALRVCCLITNRTNCKYYSHMTAKKQYQWIFTHIVCLLRIVLYCSVLGMQMYVLCAFIIYNIKYLLRHILQLILQHTINNYIICNPYKIPSIARWLADWLTSWQDDSAIQIGWCMLLIYACHKFVSHAMPSYNLK